MKASDYRQLQSKKPTATANVTLPSGAVFVLRRPPLDAWTKAGRVPDFFIRLSLEAGQGDAAAVTDSLSTDEIMSSLKFMREVLLYSVVEPKLKAGATEGDDELDPADIDAEDVEFLTGYILFKGCPDIPVATKEGQVSVTSLGNFRQKQPGGVSVGAEPDGEADGQASVKAA